MEWSKDDIASFPEISLLEAREKVASNPTTSTMNTLAMTEPELFPSCSALDRGEFEEIDITIPETLILYHKGHQRVILFEEGMSKEPESEIRRYRVTKNPQIVGAEVASAGDFLTMIANNLDELRRRTNRIAEKIYPIQSAKDQVQRVQLGAKLSALVALFCGEKILYDKTQWDELSVYQNFTARSGMFRRFANQQDIGPDTNLASWVMPMNAEDLEDATRWHRQWFDRFKLQLEWMESQFGI